jgi:hypothetical protein
MKRWIDEDEQRSMMLVMLQDASDWVGSNEIEKKTGMGEWHAFETAMDLLSEGYPVCVQHLEGCWLNFTASKVNIAFRLASSPGDLAQMRYMLDAQLAFLCRIRTGIEKAQERFAFATTNHATTHCLGSEEQTKIQNEGVEMMGTFPRDERETQ